MNGCNDDRMYTQTGFTPMHTAAQFGQIEFLRHTLVKVDATMVSKPPKIDTGLLMAVNAEVNSATKLDRIRSVFVEFLALFLRVHVGV
jgi:hypothetical protein